MYVRFDNASQRPAANQHAALWDSTRWFGELQPTAALPAPGERLPWLEDWFGRFEGWLKPVGFAVTIGFYLRTGNTGTNADWELDTFVSGTNDTGTLSIPDGTTQFVSWLPKTPGARINILAGGTAPTRIDGGGKFVGRDAGT